MHAGLFLSVLSHVLKDKAEKQEILRERGG